MKYTKHGKMLLMGDHSGSLHILPYPYTSLHSTHTTPDYLEVELEENDSISINRLEVFRSSDTRAQVITAVDKSIKLFKIFRQPGPEGFYYTGKADNELDGVHECTINSISLCSNDSNFLSSDDLNIYLWDISRKDKVFHAVSHKQTVQEINEVITSAKFHPERSHELLWTSTNGTIRTGDLRTKLIMDRPTSTFKYSSNSSWYYEDLVQSISYAEFCRNFDLIVARDYFTVKFWDLRVNSAPVLVADVVEDKNLSMRDVCESQVIFYDFEVKDSPGSEFVVTGGREEVLTIARSDGRVNRVQVATKDFVVHIDVNDEGVAAYASANSMGFVNLKGLA